MRINLCRSQAGENSMVAVINTMVDGVGAYATNDLLAPHPTLPGYYKVFGRADDQIIHNTGEKVREKCSSASYQIQVFPIDESWSTWYVTALLRLRRARR